MIKKIIRSVLFISGLALILTVSSIFMAPKKDIYNVSAFEHKVNDLEGEKDNTIDVTEEIAPSNKQIVIDDREANAKKFLCVMLAIIVAFVGVVCIFVNKRNKTLLAQQKIDEAEKSKTIQCHLFIQVFKAYFLLSASAML